MIRESNFKNLSSSHVSSNLQTNQLKTSLQITNPVIQHRPAEGGRPAVEGEDRAN